MVPPPPTGGPEPPPAPVMASYIKSEHSLWLTRSPHRHLSHQEGGLPFVCFAHVVSHPEGGEPFLRGSLYPNFQGLCPCLSLPRASYSLSIPSWSPSFLNVQITFTVSITQFNIYLFPAQQAFIELLLCARRSMQTLKEKGPQGSYSLAGGMTRQPAPKAIDWRVHRRGLCSFAYVHPESSAKGFSCSIRQYRIGD